ncbi:hypothetical protein AVEN_67790-1 [Araneus ventricosus]|uniref:Uncharacterized protein n=1 Tax=Araneus ventricosus TaxID=182803 RepID=A0A4Y2J756_ARAVE|nr:hypothetical protein AVEN_67790-1 [Araneus ventricosus]
MKLFLNEDITSPLFRDVVWTRRATFLTPPPRFLNDVPPLQTLIMAGQRMVLIHEVNEGNSQSEGGLRRCISGDMDIQTHLMRRPLLRHLLTAVKKGRLTG